MGKKTNHPIIIPDKLKKFGNIPLGSREHIELSLLQIQAFGMNTVISKETCDFYTEKLTEWYSKLFDAVAQLKTLEHKEEIIKQVDIVAQLRADIHRMEISIEQFTTS